MNKERFGSGLLVLVLVTAVIAALTVVILRTRSLNKNLEGRIDRLVQVRSVVGRQLEFSALSIDRSAFDSLPVALLIVGTTDCLVCLGEILEWKEQMLRSKLRIVTVISGDDGSLARKITDQEDLPFKVLADRDSTILKQLPELRASPVRLLVGGRRQVILATSGKEVDGIGFLERVEAIRQ